MQTRRPIHFPVFSPVKLKNDRVLAIPMEIEASLCPPASIKVHRGVDAQHVFEIGGKLANTRREFVNLIQDQRRASVEAVPQISRLEGSGRAFRAKGQVAARFNGPTILKKSESGRLKPMLLENLVEFTPPQQGFEPARPSRKADEGLAPVVC